MANEEEFTTTENWRLWCRLCAKEDKTGNISVFFKDEQQQANEATGAVLANANGCDAAVNGFDNESLEGRNSSLEAAIAKYFWINITRTDDLPKMLCTECFSLTTALENFSIRVAKVQEMFVNLKEGRPKTEIDFHAIRVKYGLLDEEREHVLLQRPLPEVHYLETKPKVNAFVEKLFENDVESNSATTAIESRNSTNPLKRPRIKIKIKKENILEEMMRVDGEEAAVYDDEDDVNAESEGASLMDAVDPFNGADSVKKLIPKKKLKKNCNTEDLSGNYDKKAKAASKLNNRPAKPTAKRSKRRKSRKPIYSESDDNDNERKSDVNEENSISNDVEQISAEKSSSNLADTTASAADNETGMCSSSGSNILYKCTECPRPFICEQCGVAMRTKGVLKTHMLTHTDYAPFECEVCKKAFKNQKRLKNHMETHDPNKHICAECGQQLNSRATLNRHLLVHSDEMQHACDYCGRAFKRTKELKNHLILHTGLKPYSCDFCERTFANGSNCRSHKKKAHPEELAALEAAGGGKTYTQNIPKLEALKAVTKSTDYLAPVVSKQSGCFAFGKKPKPLAKVSDGDIRSKLSSAKSEFNNSALLLTAGNMELYDVSTNIPIDLHAVPPSPTVHNLILAAGEQTVAKSHSTSSSIPSIDNIYLHIKMKKGKTFRKWLN